MNSEMIEWAAVGIGSLGTILWALGKNQLVIALLWTISSLLWIAFAIAHGHAGLTLRDVISFGLSALGVRNYWLNRATKR